MDVHGLSAAVSATDKKMKIGDVLSFVDTSKVPTCCDGCVAMFNRIRHNKETLVAHKTQLYATLCAPCLREDYKDVNTDSTKPSRYTTNIHFHYLEEILTLPGGNGGNANDKPKTVCVSVCSRTWVHKIQVNHHNDKRGDMTAEIVVALAKNGAPNIVVWCDLKSHLRCMYMDFLDNCHLAYQWAISEYGRSFPADGVITHERILSDCGKAMDAAENTKHTNPQKPQPPQSKLTIESAPKAIYLRQGGGAYEFPGMNNAQYKPKCIFLSECRANNNNKPGRMCICAETKKEQTALAAAVAAILSFFAK